MLTSDLVVQTAVFGDNGRYRYSLARVWEPGLPAVCWIMLNPSKASAEQNDPTVRRCIGFARRWRAGGIVIVNLFAMVATYPIDLIRDRDPIGPLNDDAILQAVRGRRVILGWGNVPYQLDQRAADVLSLLEGTRTPLQCLGHGMLGHPSHPLYLAGKKKPRRFRGLTITV